VGSWRPPVCGGSICKGREVDRFGGVDGLKDSARRFCEGEDDKVEEAREQRSAPCWQQGVRGVRFVESSEASRVAGN
jgi:hypothetical protein